MNEQEARELAQKATDYCYVLATAWAGAEKNSVCLERIFVKGGEEEIRLAWWTDGNQGMRPADIEATEWSSLFAKALKAGVFTDSEKFAMLRSLLQ